MLRRLRILVAVLGVLAASEGSGQPIPREKVPQQLSPWIPWALDGHEELLCPKLGGAPRCYWPGRLALTLNATGGTFSSDLVADRALLVPLPGHALSWPQDVKVDGQAVPVTESGERPFVFVSPGAHRIDGRFVWKALPDSLPLSEEIALVDLSVDGKVVPFPGRDGALLLLSRGSEVAAEEDALRLKVFRKLSDGIPLFLETRVELEVAGKAREITLPGVLPEGAVPISVDGDAAARVDKDGALRIQVRAGKFAVSIDARLSGKPESVGSPKAPAPWPDQEIWVFEANELLRQVEISGGTGMDASRTDLPEEWRRFPTYLLAPGEALAIREARRGEPELAPDQIALRRSMWLALDGSSLAVRDAFTGTVGKTSRLDLAAPGELGRASVAGQDQVITASPETKRPGVELRTIQVSVGADSTVPRASELPAVGWGVDVTSLGTTLYLPPGWRLLAAPGTDRANGAWTSRWTLFAFFFVLVVAVATARLVSKAAGVLALLTLVLCYGERGAPQAVWFFLVAATALVVLAKEGKLAVAARVFWGATALVLVITALPYFVREVRMGLYPAAFDVSADASFAPGELASEGVAYQEAGEGIYSPTKGSAATRYMKVPAPAAAPAEPQPTGAGTMAYDVAAPPPPPAESLNRLQVATKSGGDTASANLYRYEVDSNALVQTGKGIPQWQRG
ncbi:MAG: hypothetical protein JNK60_11780, partial [Acidobacteria bacterium]|nr:hypothetical protein [Acidobacteriota bacterium]